MASTRKKYVAVGTGGRIPMFIDPIVRDYAGDCELLAFCDLSRVRMEYHRERLARSYGYRGEIRIYPADGFDRMLDEVRPDTVIVCTRDSAHHESIIRSLEKGCDVVCEKPITVDDARCREIQEAVRRTGRRVRVTFNVRWSPGVTRVRELIAGGAIGRVRHVNLEYLLDTAHGADYFRRWHSEKASSGGLLVHKSTHHFDLVNWLIDGIPRSVYAVGDLVFYGKANAIARGEEPLTRYERYTGAPAGNDPFHFDLDAGEATRGLYRAAEAESGYIRDRNVFREGIDIEDSMSVIVRYRDGAMLSYSLNAFCPREGYRLALSGDRGRIEYEERHASHIITGLPDGELAQAQSLQRTLRVLPLFAPPYEVGIPHVEGGHGGGDALLQEQIFSPDAPEDPWGRSAGHEQGIASALIGIAANRSIESGLPVCLDDLVTLRPGAVRLSELV